MAGVGEMQLPGIPRCEPEEVGLAREALELHTESMRRQMKMGYLPGVAECLLKDNRLAYVGIQGYQDKEMKLPMTEKSLHRCFSLTKPVTAAGMMVLWEEGKLALDDPVSKYIPAFKHMNVVRSKHTKMPGPRGGGLEKARRAITLRHLVCHTSGLGYGPSRLDKRDKLVPNGGTEGMYLPFVERLDNGSIPDLESFCEELARLPLRFHPGERWKYSMGMDVLGRVLEVVSGMPLDSFLRDRVLKPLGMKDTSFFVTPCKARRHLTAFYCTKGRRKNQKTKLADKFVSTRHDGKLPEASAWVAPSRRQKQVLSGGGIAGSCAGGLLSSLRDQAIFCSAIINLGYAHSTGLQVLKPSTVKAMCKDWLQLKSVRARKHLHGWGMRKVGWCPFGHVAKDELFMGGTGSWCINTAEKTVVVSFPNNWCNDDVHGWDEKVDDLVGAGQQAISMYKRALQNFGKAKAPCTEPPEKRARTA